MRWILLVVMLHLACGSVEGTKLSDGGLGGAGALGASCTASTDCSSGFCADGVCCNQACTGACEACAASKTGKSDGACAPVTANTDPDNDCPATCTDGALSSMCDGHGACAVTSCGGYQCDGATACLSTCTESSDCTDDYHCGSGSGGGSGSGVCMKRLRVALVAAANSCLDANTDDYPVVAGLLAARGHDPVFALDTDINTPAKIAAFDVIILGGPGNGCSNVGWATYDAVLPAYVNAGGGLVTAGWTLYNESLGIPSSAPNMIALMPNAGAAYIAMAATVTPTGTHPISVGLTAFNAPSFLPYGSTTPNAGSTVLALSGTTPVAEAWSVGSGRTVYLGPLYFESFPTYANQTLVNGTQASSVEMLLRAVEWAGHER